MKDPDVEDLARRYRAGESLGGMAKALGISHVTVGRRPRAHGVEIRDRASSIRRSKVRGAGADIDDIGRRYLGGGPAAAIAKAPGVCGHTVRSWPESRGIEIRSEDGSGKLGRRSGDDAEIVRRYRAGGSEPALSAAFGIARGGIRKRLIEGGIRIRGRSRGALNRFRRMSPEARLALAKPSHAAVRGVPKGEEQPCKIAITRRVRPVQVGPSERAVRGWPGAFGAGVVPREAVGRYDVDPALAEGRIAVEIFGGNRHASGRHAPRFRPRIEYLADRGRHTVVVRVTTRYPPSHAVADDLIALHEAVREGETSGREEHVMRGDGYVASVRETKPHDGAIVTGFHPRHRNRGQDGRIG
jgi:hypothetical protein